MKKLMVACVAAAVAVAANASTVLWNSGAVLADSGNGTGWSAAGTKITKSSTDYTMTVLIYSAYNDGELSGLIGTGEKNGTGAKNNISDKTMTNPDLAASPTKYYAQARIDNSANGSYLMSQIIEFSWVGGMDDPTLDFMKEAAQTGVASIASKNGTFSSTTGYWEAQGWQSVPEPTSGLLLLIGVAGLALRRRRA